MTITLGVCGVGGLVVVGFGEDMGFLVTWGGMGWREEGWAFGYWRACELDDSKLN